MHCEQSDMQLVYKQHITHPQPQKVTTGMP